MTEITEQKHWRTSDELYTVKRLAGADMIRVNRIRSYFGLPPIDTGGLLSRYIRAARARQDWGDVDAEACIGQAQRLLVRAVMEGERAA